VDTLAQTDQPTGGPPEAAGDPGMALLIAFGFGLLLFYPYWRSFQRAGMPGWFALTVLVPFIGWPAGAAILAFVRWPAGESKRAHPTPPVAARADAEARDAGAQETGAEETERRS
jgi:hypothetical protein